MKVISNLQVFMGFIRAILYYLTVFTGMIIIGTPYIIYKGLICRRKHEITNICTFYFKNVVFKLFGIKIKVEGAENIPKERGFIIVANHASFLDINVIWPTLGNTAFIAKAALWKAPVFGWVLNSIGCIPVHKNPRMNAGMGKLVRKRLDDKYNIAVFPEGHRSEDGHMYKFQNGIFRMAKENKLPLLPITLIGTGDRLPKVKWAMNPGEVRIVVHPLQTPESFENTPMNDLRDTMHDLIESALPYKKEELAQAQAASGTAKEA
jgi:1-acyl-sn-glycerol-3-phosphate acyltransferase